MSIDYNNQLNRAYLEGLTSRLDKKRVKLGEITKELCNLSSLHEELIEEIKTIKKTIEHAQNSDN